MRFLQKVELFCNGLDIVLLYGCTLHVQEMCHEGGSGCWMCAQEQWTPVGGIRALVLAVACGHPHSTGSQAGSVGC